MSRTGDYSGHAVAESFFSMLKKELLRGRRLESPSQAKSTIFNSISRLNYRTPESYEHKLVINPLF